MFGLEGKNLLVLGGGLGMGESTCLTLASVGANVAVADVERDRAERVASAVIDDGVRAVPIAVDVTQIVNARDRSSASGNRTGSTAIDSGIITAAPSPSRVRPAIS